MSASKATIRLLSDLKNISEEPPEGISASPLDNKSLLHWTASIIGPDESPFEGGIYSLNLTFNESYPDTPPKIKFTTSMFHPNVYQDGSICLDILDKAWSPIYSVSSILTSIQSLLTDANPSSPANIEAANLYITDRKAYNRKVRVYAEKSIN